MKGRRRVRGTVVRLPAGKTNEELLIWSGQIHRLHRMRNGSCTAKRRSSMHTGSEEMWMRTRTHAHTHARTHAFTRTRIHAHAHSRACTYMHTYTHTCRTCMHSKHPSHARIQTRMQTFKFYHMCCGRSTSPPSPPVELESTQVDDFSTRRSHS